MITDLFCQVIFMVISTIPAFIGMLALALLPKDGMLWTRWGLYLMTVTGNLPGLLIWTFLPSNVAGRTKKSVTGTVIFVAYCVGNSIGAQTFRAEWAPKYIPSIIICATMYALECCLFISWRFYCMSTSSFPLPSRPLEKVTKLRLRIWKNIFAD